MQRLLFFATALVFALSACGGCDKKTDTFDAAWDRVQPLVMNASNDAERIRILKAFIAEHKGHERLGPIEKQLAALESNTTDSAPNVEIIADSLTREEKEENVKEAYAKLKAGELDPMVDLVVRSTLARGGGTKNTASIDTVTVEHLTGEERDYEGSKNVLEITVRSGLMQTLRTAAPDTFKKCNAACLNEYLNTYLNPIAKGPLYLEPGRLSKSAVDNILAALKITADSEFGGATLSELYRVLEPSFKQSLAVREAIRKQGDDRVLTAFRIAKKDGSRALKKWYKAYPVESGMTESLPEGLRRRVDLSNGFWIRRINDGTADSLESFIKSVQKTAIVQQ